MLRLENIKKIYDAAGMQVEALKDVSISFRKAEFVSILGPSGCGKTTLLNIIGGLDHYTSGDLFILGNSTKGFNDHDWDVYRNRRVGFVFQSYNLIPQTNIQQNVELGLAISGLKRHEREKLARDALDKVGLEGMYKKKPNQLSGGQCQRVAIARAIVNDPDIILADEPTGALDSQTSIQIMDILKELSKDRLIVMVTHNPDIANKYSTRIINLLDGNVVGDSNPYSIRDEMKEVESLENKETKSHLSKSVTEEKAKMKWATTFSLSGKNLLAKAKRTSMIVVASSIGIVGISAVLAVSSGVRGYIRSIQDDMLSGSPITISRSSLDLQSLMNSMSISTRTSVVTNNIKDGIIQVDSIVEQLAQTSTSMSQSMITNNITQDYVDFIDDTPKDYYAAIEKYYSLAMLNNLYTESFREGLVDDPTNPSDTYFSMSSIMDLATAVLSKTDYSMFSSQLSSFTSVVQQAVSEEEYVLSQYDVLPGGRFAKEKNEVMIVLDHNYRITDLTLTLLGYYSQKDLMDCIYHYSGMTDSPYYDDDNYKRIQTITVDQLMNKTFYYFPNNDIFTQTGDDARPFNYSYTPDLVNWDDGIELQVVGILAPKKEVSYGCLNAGFYYTSKLTEKYNFDNSDSNLTTFIKNKIESYKLLNLDLDSYSSSVTYETNSSTGEVEIRKSGITYDLPFSYEGTSYEMAFPVGTSSTSISSIISMLVGGGNNSRVATLSIENAGGATIPSKIEIYPKSFNKKYLVTDRLDLWNTDEDIELTNGRVIYASTRENMKYNDNLELIISLINTVITAVTIALVVFTSLSLVVSTVMISIITYVSVIERIKEIGVIRSLGGRKKDVSHLFNAETFIIGSLSGVFGVVVTYLIQIIVNIILTFNFNIAIMSFEPLTALIIIGVAILLTIIAGLIPAMLAARKDPVVALRTE